MVGSVSNPMDSTPMQKSKLSWSNSKWLIFAIPLALYGCGESSAEQAAQELRTRMDEAQVQIEAQAARMARLERALATASTITRLAGQRLRDANSALSSRTQQLKTLQQQRQALLQEQQNLRQALGQNQALAQRFNQQLLQIGQQNDFLRQRLDALMAEIRRQSSGTFKQTHALAVAQKKLVQLTAERAQSEASLAQTKNRIDHLQRARRYLSDKLTTCQLQASQATNPTLCPAQ